MNKTTTATLICAAGLLGACAQPAVAPDPPSQQHKLGALEHWRAVAKRKAAAIDAVTPPAALDDGATPGQPDTPGRTVFIRHGAPGMPFAEAFRPMLAEALRERGHRIVDEPGDAFVVDFDVDSFYYGRGDGLRATQQSAGGSGYPAFLGVLSAAGVLAADAAEEGRWSSGGAALAAAGAGVAVQMVQKLTDTTNAEVLLDLEVRRDGRVVHNTTEPFYVAAPDRALYWSRFDDPPARTRATYAGMDQNVSFTLTR